MEPILIVGLGGTGKEVLLRIRRRFFLAGYPVQPWVSYLWIDTAARQPKERWANGLPKDYVSRCTAFRDDEICDIGVTQAEATAFNNSKLSWLNIWEWAEPAGVQPALDADGLANGAKQQPPLGRLALFLKAGGQKGIVNTLSARIENLSQEKITENNKQLRENLRVDVPVNSALKIIVVGSLAGGTGAGCCVDIAAMLKAGRMGHLPGLSQHNLLKSSSIYGFFILGDAFCNDGATRTWTNFSADRVRANTHAMLQEIENLSLRRDGSSQFLTGREKAGSIHASWTMGNNLKGAPWFNVAPLYNNAFLFDGYGDGNSRLTKIEDSYELVSNLLYHELKGQNKAIETARSNEDYQTSTGHIEMVPQESTDFKDATWTDVYSFVFATAGNAQVTYDAPRARLTAAYAIGEKAILQWLGESDFDNRIKDDVAREEHRKRFEQFSSTVSRRVDEEILCKGERNGMKWSQFVRTTAPWKKLEEFNSLNWNNIPDLWRAQAAWAALHKQQAPLNKVTLAAQIETDLIANLRLDAMLREIIDGPLLPGVDGPEIYKQQGGVRAAELCIIGADKTTGMITQKLDAMINDLANGAKAKKAAADTLQQQLEKDIKTLDEYLETMEARQKEGWITGGSKKDLRANVGVTFNNVKTQIQTYGATRYDAQVFQCMSDAWRQVRNGSALNDFLESWKARLSQTRSVLDDLVTRVKNDQSSDSGTSEILTDLRRTSTDALTRLKKPELHSDSVELWKEIDNTYRQKNVNIVHHIELIQQKLLGAWRAKLMELHERGKIAEPGTFTHIVDLANHEAMPREADRLRTPEHKLSFSSRLDSLYELVDRESFSKNLLEGENIVASLTEADKQFLTTSSYTRLEAHRTHNGEIHRKDNLIGKETGSIKPPKEHRHFHAPAGLALPDFTLEPEAQRLEVRAFRVELSIPLPAVKVLSAGSVAAEGAGLQPYQLHFFKPKSGYMPVHRFDESEAMRTRELYYDIVLAVLLGQFRPSVAWENSDETCFEWRVDSSGRPQPFKDWRSISDIIRYLKLNSEMYNEIRARNEGFMRNLAPAALLALDLICQYNLAWVARGNLIFNRISEELKKQGIHDTEVPYQPVGPQQLVLESIRKKIAELLLDRHGIKLELGAAVTQTPEVTNTYELINQFLHHFSIFVPTILKPPDSTIGVKEPVVSLLALLSEVDMFQLLKPEEDILTREPAAPGERKNPVFGRLGLRAPWMLYNEHVGGNTLMRHGDLLKKTGTTMRPVSGGLPDPYSEISKRERLEDGIEWNFAMLANGNWTKDKTLYPQFFRAKALPADNPSERDAWLRKRKNLALNKSSNGTATVGVAGNPLDSVKPSVNPADTLSEFTGSFTSENIQLSLQPGADGYTGQLTIKGKSYPVKARTANGQMTGTFSTGEGAFEFVCTSSDGNLEFASGKTRQVLRPNRSQQRNPLDELV